MQPQGSLEERLQAKAQGLERGGGWEEPRQRAQQGYGYGPAGPANPAGGGGNAAAGGAPVGVGGSGSAPLRPPGNGMYATPSSGLPSGPGLVNTLSIQLQQISAVLAMAPTNPLAAGRAAGKITALAADEETARVMLAQPGCEVVLLQMASMLQLLVMPEAAAVDATYHAVEALAHMTKYPEGCRQILAKGSYPGRAMATRPPEEVVAGMMRDLFSGLAALVNAPDPALLGHSLTLLRNLAAHELVWERLRAEPQDSIGTMVSGLVLALCKPTGSAAQVQKQQQALQADLRHFHATPFTGIEAVHGGDDDAATGGGSLDVSADAAELVHMLLGNVWLLAMIVEMPNYLEVILINLTLALKAGQLLTQNAANAAVALALLTATPAGQMKLLKRHPQVGQLLGALASCFSQAAATVQDRTPYAHSRNRALAAATKVWLNLANCETFGHILAARVDYNLHDALHNIIGLADSPDAGVAAAGVVALYRLLKGLGPRAVVERHSALAVPLVASLCRGLSCPDAFVAESACAGLAMFVDDQTSRSCMLERMSRPNVENLVAGLAQLMMHPDTAAAGIAADALCTLLTGPPGEVFLARFLQGGLASDPGTHVTEEAPPGFWDFLLGKSEVTKVPDPGEVSLEVVNNAFHVLDSLLLGLATVIRKPSDKLAATNAAEVLCAVCAVESAWGRLMGQPFDLLNAILTGLAELAKCRERAAARNAAVVIHCFTLDANGMQVLSEIDRTASKNILVALHAMQSSGDSTTADLATGALSNLAQHEGWRARLQMMDMLNTFTLGS